MNLIIPLVNGEYGNVKILDRKTGDALCYTFDHRTVQILTLEKGKDWAKVYDSGDLGMSTASSIRVKGIGKAKILSSKSVNLKDLK